MPVQKWCISVFFFFKQKTAYEIVDCDWSSDVCSSDLKPTVLNVAGRWQAGCALWPTSVGPFIQDTLIKGEDRKSVV